MFLKRLSILGFKSFANRTDIEFADGITALVGPNGCGKSNVVDAIKWVLGEQAPKGLRAKDMEDVIFNGTENVKALNVAEITLTISNEEGLLQMDRPEVEIKRRLYRSGESEYFINTEKVRLKEIRELFWDTGVGKAAYSVMEQGKIDQILSSKPEDRRYLFEEAAGITRYKVREAETERKLEKTSEYIRQLELIIKEVKRSYDTLKVQSEKTMKNRALRDKIFNFDLDIHLLKLKQFRYDLNEQNEKIAKRTLDRDKIRMQMEAERKALDAQLEEVYSMEAQLVEVQKNIYGIALEKDAKETAVRLLGEQCNERKLKIEQNEVREKQILYKIEELNNDVKGKEEAVKVLKNNAENIGENIHSFEENIKISSYQIGQNEKTVQKNENEINDLEKELKDYEKQLAQITDDIVAELDAGLKKAGYSSAERRKIEADLSKVLGKIKNALKGREAVIKATEIAAVAEDVEKAIALFESYLRQSPVFIDEFLAPQGIITKKRSLDSRIRETKDGIEEKRLQIKSLLNENTILSKKINDYKATLENLRINLAQINTQVKSDEEQIKLIRRELSGQETLLKNLHEDLYLDRKRLEDIEERITKAQQEIKEIDKKELDFTKEAEKLISDIKQRNGDKVWKQDIIEKHTTELSKVQEAIEKINLGLVQTKTEMKNVEENFLETYSRDLMEFEERIFIITEQPNVLREKLSAVRSQMKDLGMVNNMAPEEFIEVSERYETLMTQMADMEKTRKDLEEVALKIQEKSSEIFEKTYNKIKKNFHTMFRRLFGGGTAQLRLSDEKNILESGIEIYAQPPGKKLEHISLLSGGECSMTAVALLFATYQVKPSPFCLLDEIDAALDEANIGHFVHLLRDFSHRSQFVIITHNKRTIASADTLLGVTMEESGITKLVTVKIEREGIAIRDEDLPQKGLWEETLDNLMGDTGLEPVTPTV